MSKMGNYVVGLQEGDDDYIEAYKKRMLKLYDSKSVAELDQMMLALRKRYDEAV